MIVQTLTLEEIDRTLYNIIRKRLVELGYLPNIEDYDTEKAYIKAKKDIEDEKGFVIEIHGVGTPEARDESRVCEITIDRKDVAVGDLGAYPAHQFKKQSDGKFTKELIPPMNSDVVYEIRVFTNSVAKERIVTEILYGLFNHRFYYAITEEYNENDDKTILVVSGGDVDVSSTDVRERVFRYIVEGVWLGSPTIVRRDIVPMTSVIFTLGVKNQNNEVEHKKDFVVEDKSQKNS